MNIKIPSEIRLRLYSYEKLTPEGEIEGIAYTIILEDKKNNVIWFRVEGDYDEYVNACLLNSSEYIKFISPRELKASKDIANKIKKGINTLKFGYTKTLKLKGVGFKANLEGNLLSLRIGKPQAAEFEIPSDVALKIEQNNVVAWSLSVSKISNFFDKILRETPVRKGGLEIIW